MNRIDFSFLFIKVLFTTIKSSDFDNFLLIVCSCIMTTTVKIQNDPLTQKSPLWRNNLRQAQSQGGHQVRNWGSTEVRLRTSPPLFWENSSASVDVLLPLSSLDYYLVHRHTPDHLQLLSYNTKLCFLPLSCIYLPLQHFIKNRNNNNNKGRNVGSTYKSSIKIKRIFIFDLIVYSS